MKCQEPRTLPPMRNALEATTRSLPSRLDLPEYLVFLDLCIFQITKKGLSHTCFESAQMAAFLWKYPEKEDGFFVGVPNFNRSTKHVFFYAISYFFQPKTQLRPLKMEVEEPFNIRVRLFVFPGAGDSVAGWIQFVNKVGNLRVVDFFEGKVSAFFFVFTKSQED